MIGKAWAAAALIGIGAALGGCTDGYGYSGVSLGYGGGYGYGYPYDGYGYYDAGYPGYFGWYGDFYYPGTGIYVYDRYRRPYRWNDAQRRYWEGRRQSYRGDPGRVRNEWRGFNRAPLGDGDRGPASRPAGSRGYVYRGVPAAPAPGTAAPEGTRQGFTGGQPRAPQAGMPRSAPRWGGFRGGGFGHSRSGRR